MEFGIRPVLLQALLSPVLKKPYTPIPSPGFQLYIAAEFINATL
jgi:hypothetical protein